MDYKSSGVDVEAGYRSVELMKRHVAATFNKGVVSELGGFGGMYSLSAFKNMEEPVLVSGTDGVGTKLKIAFLMNRHGTVGIDCVAMCVNDIVCSGAKPLFFLDYIACGKNVPERIEQIVKGVAEGCRQAGAALIGGETAEMPGFYNKDEYDIAGFAVGIADRKKIINGKGVRPGDKIIGLASSGLHSNGFSLVRKILRPSEPGLGEYVEELGEKVGDELIKPTRIYVREILNLIDKVEIRGICNITGGGFYENVPRMLPEGINASIKCGSWHVPPIFPYLQKAGKVADEVMYGTFNMGIGMCAAVSPENAAAAIKTLSRGGCPAFEIGEAVIGDGERVAIC